MTPEAQWQHLRQSLAYTESLMVNPPPLDEYGEVEGDEPERCDDCDMLARHCACDRMVEREMERWR